jgi:hypothetical protein
LVVINNYLLSWKARVQDLEDPLLTYGVNLAHHNRLGVALALY